MNKRLRFVLIVFIIYIIITVLFQQFGKMTGFIPYEVEWINYKFINNKYNQYLFDTPIEEQLGDSVYSGDTLAALHNLNLMNYNFYFAKKYIEISSNNLYGYKEFEIIKELNDIYNDVGKKAIFLGYLLSTSRFFIAVFIIKFTKKIYDNYLT